MNNDKVKFAYTLIISLIIYFLVCILVTIIIKTRFVLGDSDLYLVGCVTLFLISLIWFMQLRKYTIFRKKIGILLILVLGLLVSIVLSIAYINIRTQVNIEDPGDLGKAALALIIFLSIFSQVFGFIFGYIPMAIFMHKVYQDKKTNRRQIAK